MFLRIIIFIIFFFPVNGKAQIERVIKIDTICTSGIVPHFEGGFRKGRTIGVSSGIGAIWAGSMIGLSQIWYKDMEKTPWHTFDDSREWLQMDKVGHSYTANKISTLTGDLYQWAGWKNNSAAFMGFGVGMGYLLTLECFDATGKEWGFSWSDMGANTLGSGLYLAQQLGWKEQRLMMKFSYRHSPYAQYRPNTLGETFPERLLKDYNGQTYWLSASPGTFLKNSKFPKWLCFSVGYGIDGKLHGHDNVYTVEHNGENLTFHAQRQFFFSLDIDFSRLPIKKPWLKAIVKQFNYLKLPFPTVILTGNKWGGSWLYF